MTIITCPDCDEPIDLDEYDLAGNLDRPTLVRLHEAIVGGEREEASDMLRRIYPGELMDFAATQRLLAARHAPPPGGNAKPRRDRLHHPQIDPETRKFP